MTNPSTAIAPYERFKITLQSENVQTRFRDILEKRTPGFVASLLSVVSGNNALQSCDHASILTSAMKAAVLNLPIEPALGFAYIVPFKGKGTFVMGYKGLIQLALRTSMYVAINATEIYEGEEVKIDRLSGNIVLNGKRAGDGIIGYAGYFKLKTGFEKFHYMTVEQIAAHAKKYSKSWGMDNSAWTTNFSDMAKKTVLRLLLGKYGLLSIEMQSYEETELPPFNGDDPRFQTPDLGIPVPGFDDVVDGQATDPVNEKISEDELLQATVAAGKFENIHEARNAFKRCKVEWDTFEKATAWATAYRAWRDMDAKPEKAAEYANSGELPHEA